MTDLRAYLGRGLAFVRRHAAGTGLEILVNFVLPFVIFDLGKARLGDAGALMASGGPPIAWSIVQFARRRRVDALSMLVLAGIALSLLAFVGGGSVRFLQLREKLVTGLIGLAFLGSAAIGRPLIYHLARAGMVRRGSHAEAAEFASLRDSPFFRRTMLIMTLVCGFGLVTEAAISATLVMLVPIKTFFVVGPIVGYSFAGALALWIFLFARRQRRIGAALRAAAQAQSAPAAAV